MIFIGPGAYRFPSPVSRTQSTQSRKQRSASREMDLQIQKSQQQELAEEQVEMLPESKNSDTTATGGYYGKNSDTIATSGYHGQLSAIPQDDISISINAPTGFTDETSTGVQNRVIRPNLNQIVGACTQAKLIAQGASLQERHLPLQPVPNYRKKIVALSCGQILMGVMSSLLGLAWLAAKPSSMKLDKGLLFACTVIFLIAGISGIQGRDGHKRLALIRCLVFSVVSAIFAGIALSLNIVALYRKDYHEIKELTNCNGAACSKTLQQTELLNTKRAALYYTGFITFLLEFVITTVQLTYCCVIAMSYQVNNVYYVVANDLMIHPTAGDAATTPVINNIDIDNVTPYSDERST